MDEYGLFYRNWRGKILNYLVRMTGDCGLADEIAQEAFARHLEHYGKEEPSVPLLYRIARNLFLDEVRRRKRCRASGPETREPLLDAERHLAIRSEYRRVLLAMESLADDERDILSLAISGELTYREIAVLAGISETHVKVKVHRARLKLKKILQEGET